MKCINNFDHMKCLQVALLSSFMSLNVTSTSKQITHTSHLKHEFSAQYQVLSVYKLHLCGFDPADLFSISLSLYFLASRWRCFPSLGSLFSLAAKLNSHFSYFSSPESLLWRQLSHSMYRSCESASSC